MLNKSMMIQTHYFFPLLLMQNLYLRNVRISRIEVLGATQSLLIYCFLRIVHKKGQWLLM
jgi:hypothetical protein